MNEYKKISPINAGFLFAISSAALFAIRPIFVKLGRMILYVYPTFVVLLGALFFGQPITWRVTISLLLTYIGVSIIFGHDLDVFGNEVIIGALFILASAFTFSFYLLFSKSLMSDIGSRVFTCIALISASTGILIHYSITHTPLSPNINQTAIWLILIIAIFCTVIPTFFTTAAVSRIGADKTGIVAMIGPGFTSVFAVLILQEDFTLYHLLGITITIIGVAMLQKK